MKGDSVTLIQDCTTTVTKALLRGPASKISIDGRINIGYQSDEEGHFMVRHSDENMHLSVKYYFWYNCVM